MCVSLSLSLCMCVCVCVCSASVRVYAACSCRPHPPPSLLSHTLGRALSLYSRLPLLFGRNPFNGLIESNHLTVLTLSIGYLSYSGLHFLDSSLHRATESLFCFSFLPTRLMRKRATWPGPAVCFGFLRLRCDRRRWRKRFGVLVIWSSCDYGICSGRKNTQL